MQWTVVRDLTVFVFLHSATRRSTCVAHTCRAVVQCRIDHKYTVVLELCDATTKTGSVVFSFVQF